MDFTAILIFYKEAEVLNYTLTIEVCVLYLTTTETYLDQIKVLTAKLIILQYKFRITFPGHDIGILNHCNCFMI